LRRVNDKSIDANAQIVVIPLLRGAVECPFEPKRFTQQAAEKQPEHLK
jgi:hypothetical protein